MRRPFSDHTLVALRRVASRCSKVTHEAEDLVQDILLCAIEANRDCSDPGFLPWAAGAIRNHARFTARTAARRKRREAAHVRETDVSAQSLPGLPESFVASLPRSRRVIALLVNLGMGRQEMAYLLGLSEVAMRQRISGLRKAFAEYAGNPEETPPVLSRADGRARRALRASLPRQGYRRFAVRDPDGVPLFFRLDSHVPPSRGNKAVTKP